MHKVLTTLHCNTYISDMKLLLDMRSKALTTLHCTTYISDMELLLEPGTKLLDNQLTVLLYAMK